MFVPVWYTKLNCLELTYVLGGNCANALLTTARTNAGNSHADLLTLFANFKSALP